MRVLLIVLLVLLLCGALPQTGWHSYGYGPSGGIGLVLIVLVVMLILGIF